VDALAQLDWASHSNFVNSPFRLIPKILKFVQEQGANANLIVPWWPANPGFKLCARCRLAPLFGFQTANTFFCRQAAPQNRYTTAPGKSMLGVFVEEQSDGFGLRFSPSFTAISALGHFQIVPLKLAN